MYIMCHEAEYGVLCDIMASHCMCKSTAVNCIYTYLGSTTHLYRNDGGTGEPWRNAAIHSLSFKSVSAYISH